jgi:hypothetical protein
MDYDEDADEGRLIAHYKAASQINDATSDMCKHMIQSAKSLVENALNRAVGKRTYTRGDAQRVRDLFCDSSDALQAALSSKTRTDAFYAAQAALDMTGIALAIGEGLPSEEVIRLAKLGFGVSHRAKERARKSAKERSAEDTWKPHALKLAQQIQSEGDFTQDELADAICGRWELHGHKCPRSMLVLQIRAWQREGKLSKRSRNR